MRPGTFHVCAGSGLLPSPPRHPLRQGDGGVAVKSIRVNATHPANPGSGVETGSGAHRLPRHTTNARAFTAEATK